MEGSSSARIDFNLDRKEEIFGNALDDFSQSCFVENTYFCLLMKVLSSAFLNWDNELEEHKSNYTVQNGKSGVYVWHTGKDNEHSSFDVHWPSISRFLRDHVVLYRYCTAFFLDLFARTSKHTVKFLNIWSYTIFYTTKFLSSFWWYYVSLLMSNKVSAYCLLLLR